MSTVIVTEIFALEATRYLNLHSQVYLPIIMFKKTDDSGI